MIKELLSRAASFAASKLLYALHNRNTFSLDREEWRQVALSFSLCGEDQAVLRHARNLGVNRGVYVDAGAFHPIQMSNTLLLHKLGWRGINIDMQPHKIELFRRLRPNDHNVVAALSSQVCQAGMVEYAEGATARIVTSRGENAVSLIGEAPRKMSEVRTTTLTAVIEESRSCDGPIHYLNIDCEGHDLMVLQGLDLKRYRPWILTIEAFSESERQAIANHLLPWGYELMEILGITALFVLCDVNKEKDKVTGCSTPQD